MTLIDLMYQRSNHSNFRWYNPTKSVTLETVKFRCGNSQWVCENDNEYLALVLCSLEVFSQQQTKTLIDIANNPFTSNFPSKHPPNPTK